VFIVIPRKRSFLPSNVCTAGRHTRFQFTVYTVIRIIGQRRLGNISFSLSLSVHIYIYIKVSFYVHTILIRVPRSKYIARLKLIQLVDIAWNTKSFYRSHDYMIRERNSRSFVFVFRGDVDPDNYTTVRQIIRLREEISTRSPFTVWIPFRLFFSHTGNDTRIFVYDCNDVHVYDRDNRQNENRHQNAKPYGCVYYMITYIVTDLQVRYTNYTKPSKHIRIVLCLDMYRL